MGWRRVAPCPATREVDQGPVDLSLVERIDAVECVGDLPVDVVDGLEDAIAAEPVPAVSELDRLMDARRGTRGGDGAALRTLSRDDLGLITWDLPRESRTSRALTKRSCSRSAPWCSLARYHHSNATSDGPRKWSVTISRTGSPRCFRPRRSRRANRIAASRSAPSVMPRRRPRSATSSSSSP